MTNTVENKELVEQTQETTKLIPDEVSLNTCENCHAVLSGPFCGQCGQGSESSLKYFWVVILHLLDDIFSFDSRASRTIWPLLTKPAFLTNEYIAGRRVHYVPPLRLYLFISIVFFITLKFLATGESNNNILNINGQQSTMEKVTKHIDNLTNKKTKLEAIESTDKEALINLLADIDKFTGYKTDLAKKENIIQSELVNEIIKIELDSDNDNNPLTEKRKQRLTELKKQLLKSRNGELITFENKPLTIGNNKDGTFTFDFLSPEDNKKLNSHVDVLEKKVEKAVQTDMGPLVQEAIGKLPQLMFILLPLFAALLKIMFLFSKRLYMEHLTVALHSHSFLFFSVLLLELLSVIEDRFIIASSTGESIVNILAVALVVWMPIYLFIMQKRVYKQGYFFTTVKYFIIGSSYMILIVITGMVAFIWGLTDI
jgi:hypothetical protein